MSNITRLYHVCGLHWTTTIPIIPIDTVHLYFDPTGPIGFVFTGPPGGVGAIVRRTQGRFSATIGSWNWDLHEPTWRRCQQLGVSENSVPLNPMVNDHYPY